MDKQDRISPIEAFTKRSPHHPQPQTMASKIAEKNKSKAVDNVSKKQPKPTCRKHFYPRDKKHAVAQASIESYDLFEIMSTSCLALLGQGGRRERIGYYSLGQPQSVFFF